MITGIRSIQGGKLNVVHPVKLRTLYYTKDLSYSTEQKLVPINSSGVKRPIGLASLPQAVRKSRFFTGSDLFKLSKLKSVPSGKKVKAYISSNSIPKGKDASFYYRKSKNPFRCQ